MINCGLESGAEKYRVLSSLISFTVSFVLVIEYFLGLKGKSLCTTSACDIVGHYIFFGESTLIAGGCLFFLLVFSLTFLFLRRSQLRKFENITLYILSFALAFDSGLLGFQFFIIEQKCILCIFVAVTLLIIFTLCCIANKSYKFLFLGLIFWVGSFFSTSILDLPENQGNYEKSNIVLQNSRHSSLQTAAAPVFTLFFSMDCPHCQNVLEYLSHIDTKNHIWRLSSIDSDIQQLGKLQRFLVDFLSDENIFAELLIIKNNPELSPLVNIKDIKKLKSQTKSARQVLISSNINTVPVLLIEELDFKKSFIIGSDRIIKYLESFYEHQ